MQYRTLGRTSVKVSTLALGTMNFGKIGNTNQAEVTTIDGTRLRARAGL